MTIQMCDIKNEITMFKSSNFHYILTCFILVFSLSMSAQDLDNGKTLFKNNCASCHAKTMKTDMTGPALAGFMERWADYPMSDLYKWIRNSQGMIAEGHPRAVELWNDWKPVVMQANQGLTDVQIDDIFGYINGVSDGTYGPPPPPPVDPAVAQSNGASNWLYYGLFALLAFLAIILARIISNLSRMQAEKDGVPYESKNLLQTIFSKGVISFLLFILIVMGGYYTVNNAMNLGRQKGYAPDQPIKFSHATHAGIQKIDCQYCHDGARRSKHSVIPAANTCMNCHAAIKEGSEYGTAELTKVYASIGFDPTTGKYIDDYHTSFTNADAEKVYTKWIADSYMKAEGVEELGREGEREVKEQWDGIVSSLTNEQKDFVGGPIEWIRIHNLPDHVYFNHAQHVTVGKLECQECHGQVEQMDVMAQHSPLSMGWCINCHRETEVQFAGNDYYKSYEKYHSEMASGLRDKVTVEDIGGLECQKCHY